MIVALSLVEIRMDMLTKPLNAIYERGAIPNELPKSVFILLHVLKYCEQHGMKIIER